MGCHSLQVMFPPTQYTSNTFGRNSADCCSNTRCAYSIAHRPHLVFTLYPSPLSRSALQSEDYSRARTAAGITAFVLEQSRPAVVPLATVADAQVQHTLPV
jgi:hypothetical protein